MSLSSYTSPSPSSPTHCVHKSVLYDSFSIAVEGEFLTAGPPGKSQQLFYFIFYKMFEHWEYSVS